MALSTTPVWTLHSVPGSQDSRVHVTDKESTALLVFRRPGAVAPAAVSTLASRAVAHLQAAQAAEPLVAEVADLEERLQALQETLQACQDRRAGQDQVDFGQIASRQAQLQAQLQATSREVAALLAEKADQSKHAELSARLVVLRPRLQEVRKALENPKLIKQPDFAARAAALEKERDEITRQEAECATGLRLLEQPLAQARKRLEAVRATARAAARDALRAEVAARRALVLARFQEAASPFLEELVGIDLALASPDLNG